MAVKVRDDVLVKGQIKVIDELQEKVRLQAFDIARNLEAINSLKDKIERKNISLAKAREELELMEKENNYKNIGSVLNLLREMSYDD